MTTVLSPSTSDLFEGLRRGERRAQEEVYRRYGNRVASIARRHLGARLRAYMETADVAQDAMMSILDGARRCRFDSERAFLRWVSRVVENQIQGAARYWRARRRVHRAQDVQAAQPADRRAATPSEELSLREDMSALFAALASLSQGDREVIIARSFLKLPWSEVATAVGARIGAAQMRFARARRRLLETMDRRKEPIGGK